MVVTAWISGISGGGGGGRTGWSGRVVVGAVDVLYHSAGQTWLGTFFLRLKGGALLAWG